MLTASQIEFYGENGYLVVPDAIAQERMARARAKLAELIEASRRVSASDAIYDLEDAHTPKNPRVRRIKDPHKVDEVYADLLKASEITDIVAQLIGPDLRMEHTKLNLKPARGGEPVEWHQDWAFYPHTNDDILEVGVMIEDCTMENGPLLIIPGSHRGPVFDHHYRGHFAGAIDPVALGPDIRRSVAITGKAGTHLTAPRPHRARLEGQPLRARPAATAVRLLCRRRLAAARRRVQGSRKLQRPYRARQADDRTAPARRPGANALSASAQSGVNLREPEARHGPVLRRDHVIGRQVQIARGRTAQRSSASLAGSGEPFINLSRDKKGPLLAHSLHPTHGGSVRAHCRKRYLRSPSPRQSLQFTSPRSAREGSRDGSKRLNRIERPLEGKNQLTEQGGIDTTSHPSEPRIRASARRNRRNHRPPATT